jgi:hypothetical protein
VLAPDLTPVARRVAAGMFGSLARGLGTRPLHPVGIAFAGEWVLDAPTLPGVEVFDAPARRPVLVRFSRGFGLPEPLPEILSVAVKVPDAYGPGRDQDVLMTATGDRPVLRHAFAVGFSHLTCTYSTVFPFAVGGRRMLLGAVPAARGRAPDAGDLGELEVLATRGELALELRVATLTGPWRAVARVELGRRLDADAERELRFNSDNAGGGIAPVGFVNAVRGAAYAAANRERP